MYRTIKEIEKSPFNKTYFILLECGHRITRKRRPFGQFDCKECEKTKPREVKEGV